jgi:excisionase family DNA binding protein
VEDELWRPGQVAKYLGVHVNTVKKMEDLPCYRLGTRGDRRYRKSDIEAWLETKHTNREP